MSSTSEPLKGLFSERPSKLKGLRRRSVSRRSAPMRPASLRIILPLTPCFLNRAAGSRRSSHSFPPSIHISSRVSSTDASFHSSAALIPCSPHSPFSISGSVAATCANCLCCCAAFCVLYFLLYLPSQALVSSPQTELQPPHPTNQLKFITVYFSAPLLHLSLLLLSVFCEIISSDSPNTSSSPLAAVLTVERRGLS